MELIVGGSFQGKSNYAEKNYEEKNLWKNFHLYVKEQLSKGKSAEEIGNEIQKRISDNPDLVIISNELGCGVIPLEKSDRDYREITGRLLCEIADKAEKVFRITCGIPVRIK